MLKDEKALETVSSEEEWDSSRRMVDKYDTPTLDESVVAWAKKHAQDRPAFAYAAALLLHEPSVATSALPFEPSDGLGRFALYDALDQVDKDRLDADFDRQRILRMNYVLDKVDLGKQPHPVTHNGHRAAENAHVVWATARGQVKLQLTPGADPASSMRREIWARREDWKTCQWCNQHLNKKTNELFRRWRQYPEGLKGLKLRIPADLIEVTASSL